MGNIYALQGKGYTGKTATIKLACEKILLFVVVSLVLFGCASVPKASEPDLEAIRRVAGQIDYYDHLGDYIDYYNDGNQFQGQCNDYSLMYSLETGAYIVAVNNFVKNGIYKVVSVDPAGSASIAQRFSKNSNQPRTPSGELQSFFYSTNDNNGERYGLYHPKIGAYKITFVTTNPDVERLARSIGNQHVFNAHHDGSGGWTYVDVTLFDRVNDWRVDKWF
jgi:hypothetical protein